MNGFKIQTGDWVGSAWGTSPHYTPYAQAIADHYLIQVPWYLTLPVTLSKAGGVVPLVTQITQSYQHDVLILGISATVASTGQASHRWTYVNVTHQESGVPWAAPTRIGYIPIGAIAGLAVGDVGGDPTPNPMSILRLPEAFFLPAHTRLKLDWTFLDFNQPGPLTITIRFTFCGVQLIKPYGSRAPRKIVMPDGETIDVGSRLPWFATVPMGEYQSRAIDDFQFNPNSQITQFFPPQDCKVEVHDTFSNFSVVVVPSGVVNKLTDVGAQTLWTPGFAPLQSVFGGELQVNPALPFVKPYMLRRGHRLQVGMINTFNAITIDSSTVTFRGVRLCEY